MLDSAIDKVVKYDDRPKQRSNNIRILEKKFEFEKKELNIPNHKYCGNQYHAILRTDCYRQEFLDTVHH